MTGTASAPQRVGAEVHAAPVEVSGEGEALLVVGHARVAAQGLRGEDLLRRLVRKLQQRAAADILHRGK